MPKTINNFSLYKIEDKIRNSVFQFFPSKKLPSKYPITTPFTFTFIGSDLVLCFDKNNQWNPLGGHMEIGENYKDTLIRESNEEAGVAIIRSSIKTIGYILNTNLKSNVPSKYPNVNILPITVSFVSKVDQNWTPLETKTRGIFRRSQALSLMKKRNDNNQMYEILQEVYRFIDEKKHQTSFNYFPNKKLPNVPVTQVFTFCKDNTNKFCIVRDHDESFFSLPGGGCELGETPEECINRELDEEAQISCKNMKLLGSIVVKLTYNNKVVSKFQQLRYLADLNIQKEFIPQKDRFEVIERQFVPLSELKSKVMILQNPNGELIIDQINSLL